MSEDVNEVVAAETASLAATQSVRERIMNGLVNGALAEKNLEQLGLVLKAADGMDKQTLGKMRHRQNDRENDAKDKEVAIMAEYLIRRTEQRAGDVRQETPNGPSRMAGRALPDERRPTYDSSLADPKASSENSAEFDRRMEEKNGKPAAQSA